MATADGVTYIYVPPPPLPEFYASRRRGDHGSSSTAEEEIDDEAAMMQTPILTADGVYDGKARPDIRSAYPMPLMAVPPMPYGPNGPDVAPLAVYHICRVCLRTRSARYHREHPIPIDGLPPPPGICRRCRVTSIEETRKVAEVIIEKESAPIKLGCIAPFVPDEAIISNEEMGRIQAEKAMSSMVDERPQKPCQLSDCKPRRSDIVYRHVHVVDEAEKVPLMRTRTAKVTFSSGEDEVETSDDEPAPVVTRRSVKATKSMQVQPRENPASVTDKTTSSKEVQPTENPAPVTNKTSSVTRKATSSKQSQPTECPAPKPTKPSKDTTLQTVDVTRTSVSKQQSPSSSRTGTTSDSRSGTKSSSKTSAAATVKAIQPPVPPLPPIAPTAPDIRGIAPAEIERYHSETLGSERKEDFVRKIARDEIERYRQAERRIDAHPGPYAHGRMVPVERRIERQRDPPAPKPWTKSEDKKEAKSQKEQIPSAPSKPVSNHTANQSSAPRAGSTSQYISDDTDGAKDHSWGPKWRREVSVERRNSGPKDDIAQSAKASVTKEQQKGKASDSTARTEQSKSVQLREVFDRVPESDPPRWSSRAEPYVVHVRRRAPERMDNIVEVIEEVDIPPRTDESSDKKQEPAPAQFPGWWADFQSRHGSKDMPEKDERPAGEQAFARLSRNQESRTASRTSRLPDDDDIWREPTVRTLDSRSTRFYEASGSGGTPQDSLHPSTRRSGRSSHQPAQSDVSRDILAIRSPRAVGTWNEDASERSSRKQSVQKQPPPYPESDEPPLRTVRPGDTVTERSERSRSAKSSSKRSSNDDGTDYTYTRRTVRPASASTGRSERVEDPQTTSAKDDDTQYTYSKRTIRPADCPTWTQQSGSSVQARRVEVEEWVETKRYAPWDHEGQQRDLEEIRRRLQEEAREQTPTASHDNRTSGAASFTRSNRSRYEGSDTHRHEGSGKPSRGNRRYENDPASSGKSGPSREDTSSQKSHLERRPKEPQPAEREDPALRRQRRRNERVRESDESNHVHFSKKVDVTPTPPDSDDSSSVFRSYHSVGRRSGRQVDGSSSPERGMQLVGEFQTRGRMRSRDSTRSEGNQYERENRPEDREIEFRHVRPPKKGKDADTGSLDRALSESPSREWSLPPRHEAEEEIEQKYDGGGPYRVVEKMSGSMRVEDGRPAEGPGSKRSGRSAQGH